jgi:hypothetical protein
MGGISVALGNIEKSAVNSVDNIGNTLGHDLGINKPATPPPQTQTPDVQTQTQAQGGTQPQTQDKTSILSQAKSTLTNFGHSVAGALGVGKTSAGAVATAAVTGGAVAGPLGAAAAGGVTAAVVGGASLAANQENKQGADASAGSILKDNLVSGVTGIGQDLGLLQNSPLTKTGYPPIYGGTQAQANQIWGYMDGKPPMPLADRQAVHSIHVGSNYTTGAFQTVAKGANGQDQNFGDIYLNTNDLKNQGQYVVLHESGHAVEIHNGTLQGPTASVWNGPDIYGTAAADSQAGEANNPAAETFADAYAAYYSGNGAALQKVAPQEYNAIASGAYKAQGPSTVTTGDQVMSGLTNFGEAVSSGIGWLGNTIGGAVGAGLAAAGNGFLANTGFGANAFAGSAAPVLQGIGAGNLADNSAGGGPRVPVWGG